MKWLENCILVKMVRVQIKWLYTNIIMIIYINHHSTQNFKIPRKMSLNYALGLLMYSCRFCSCKTQTKAASRARTEYGSNQ